MSAPHGQVLNEIDREDETLATISQMRECLVDLEWDGSRRHALAAHRERIVQRLHSIAVHRLRSAGRGTPRASR